MQQYEIQLPERGYQRTPPYTGYIEIEPLSMPGYGERRKPMEKEIPTTYRFPTTHRLPGGMNELEMLLSSGDKAPSPFLPFFPTSTGLGISLPHYEPEIKDTHETFKIDRYDNIYGTHTTITIGDKKKNLPWDWNE